jgi:hypothetical protein
MPLTRNLYTEDEVVAALQLCILRGKTVEAVFWAKEMLDSQMIDDFIRAMREIWLLGFGIGALRWYERFSEVVKSDELDESVLISYVVGLCCIGINGGRDTTFLVIKGYDGTPEVVRECVVPSSLSGLDSYFAASILQGRVICAWRVLHFIGAEVIELMAEYKHGIYGKMAIGILYRDYPELLIAALSLPKGELERRWLKPFPQMLSEVALAIKEWEAIINLRERRVYTIPHECLYWLTSRGYKDVYTTNEKDIMGSLEKSMKLWGSTYWDGVAETYGGWSAIKNEAEVREAFYDQHFPHDIPDEWSKKDRNTSHGCGAVQPGATCSAERFLRTWFGRISSAVIWNKFNTAITSFGSCSTLADIIGGNFYEKIPVENISEISNQRRGRGQIRLQTSS